jgi:hypothetical protein
MKVLNAFRPREKDRENVFTKYVSFDYLGYKFHIASDGHQPSLADGRHVWLDIADSKVKRIKSRLIRSYLDFLRGGDYALLEMRVKHLASNISLLDRSKGVRRLSGIHYSYPLVDVSRSTALRELDHFLRSSLASTHGPIFSQLAKALSKPRRRALMVHSFYSGAARRRIFQFNLKDLARIQRCWKYA